MPTWRVGNQPHLGIALLAQWQTGRFKNRHLLAWLPTRKAILQSYTGSLMTFLVLKLKLMV